MEQPDIYMHVLHQTIECVLLPIKLGQKACQPAMSFHTILNQCSVLNLQQHTTQSDLASQALDKMRAGCMFVQAHVLLWPQTPWTFWHQPSGRWQPCPTRAPLRLRYNQMDFKWPSVQSCKTLKLCCRNQTAMNVQYVSMALTLYMRVTMSS